MIYKVYLDGTSIHNMTPGLELVKGTCSQELNGAGSCDITLPQDHLHYDLAQPMLSEIDIYEGDKIVWFGRVTDYAINWNKEKKLSAEGALAYFNDSILRPKVWDNEYILTIFAEVIDLHNRQVPADRQFSVGIVTVDNVKVTRTVDYTRTYEVLQDQFIKANGGYMFVRKVVSGDTVTRYIDWYKVIPFNAGQPVQFALNLLDLNESFTGTDLITSIIPLGDDGEGNKVTVETAMVDGHVYGYDYIDNDEAVETYGRICEIIEFNDVSDPDKLYKQGVQYLTGKQFDHISIECDVAELNYLNPEYDAFSLGQNVHVYSTPHVIDTTLAISKISYDITSASKKVTIGTPARQDLSEITGTVSSGSSGQSISGGGGSGGGGGGGGGGSTVTVTPIIETGDSIGIITVNGHPYTFKYDASSKANVSDVYTKTQTDTLLGYKVITLTQAEYDELSAEEKNDPDKVYYIPDGSGGGGGGGGGGTVVIPNPEGEATDILRKIQIGLDIYGLPEGTKVVANPIGQASEELLKIKVGNTTYSIPQPINVEANPSDTASTDLSKLKVGSTTYSIPEPTTVEANPSGTASNDLTKLQVGSSIYGIPQPIDVEGNPSEAASTDLEKIKIGSSVYGIPEVIDVEANPSGTASTDLDKLKVGSSIYGIPQPTEVVANPSASAGSDLTKLQVGNSVYSIPEPIDVEANPQGTASADLTKLKVGNSVYGIPEPIDVEANPSDSASSDLSKLKVGSTTYGIPEPTEVVANPSGTASTDLNKIQVGNKVYGIPEGDSVEGNPSGSATETLTKLGINNTVYGIPEGTTVVANPSGSASTDLTKLQVGSSIYGIPEVIDVEANPSGSATTDLNKLKVGSNIYGIPEPTDVEANPSGSATTDLAKLKVGSSIYGIPEGTNVVANPSGSGSTDLSKLQVGNDIYNIPSGGGTTVVANPSGQATDDLTKIQIGNDIYDIVGGGSGGSGYEETVIYTASASEATYQLSKPLTDFDAIQVFIKYANSGSYETSGTFVTSNLVSGVSYGVTTDGWYTYFSVTDASTLARQDTNGAFVNKIIGLKFGGVEEPSDKEITPITAAEYDELTIEEKNNGQVYFVSPMNYTYTTFMDDAIVVRENGDDATDIKMFFVGLEKTSDDISISDSDLLDYLSDITNGYKKATYSYSDANGTRNGNIGFYNTGSGVKLRSWTQNWQSLVGGTFYGVIDLNEDAISASSETGQNNTYSDPFAVSGDYLIYYMSQIYGGGSSPEPAEYELLHMNGFRKNLENSGVMSYTFSDAQIESKYASGSQIGANCSELIDFSDIGRITGHIKITGGYGNFSNFQTCVGVTSQYFTNINTLTFNANNALAYHNISTGVGEYDFDLDVNDIYYMKYLMFITTGTSCVISNVKLFRKGTSGTSS